MTIETKHADTLSGTATPPSSKSHTIRALLLATMARGTSRICNALEAEDTANARTVCEQLGAHVTVETRSETGMDLTVQSHGIPLALRSQSLFSGDSGITTRFVLPMLGLTNDSGQPLTLDCGKQMRTRPMAPLVEALNNLGMDIRSRNGTGSCPLICRGKLVGGKAAVDGVTSQYASALLLCLPCAERDSEITVNNLHERPYVEMTARWLREQGIVYDWQREAAVDRFQIKGGQRYKPFTTTIPGDFSSAAVLIAAAALRPGRVELLSLDMNDTQADRHLASMLHSMEAEITVEGRRMVVSGGRALRGHTIDCGDTPDLVPVLAVIGTQARGITRLTNVPQARLKETDRLHAMATELSKMGAKIEETADGLVIGQSELNGASLSGHHDHRTIMALVVAGLCAKGQTTIDTAEGINKTFPGFVSLMQSLGAPIEMH